MMDRGITLLLVGVVVACVGVLASLAVATVVAMLF